VVARNPVATVALWSPEANERSRGWMWGSRPLEKEKEGEKKGKRRRGDRGGRSGTRRGGCQVEEEQGGRHSDKGGSARPVAGSGTVQFLN
jgi:hypothetical protein